MSDPISSITDPQTADIAEVAIWPGGVIGGVPCFNAANRAVVEAQFVRQHIEAQTTDIREARAEFEFRARQLSDQTSYARLADMPVNPLAASAVYAKYVEARDAYLSLVGAL